MFTALTLSLALGAPVPADAPTAPTGPAPQVVELKPDANGKVMVTVTRMEQVNVGVGNAIAPAGGAPAVITRQIQRMMQVELGAVKDLAVTTAGGKKVDKADALKRVEKGGVVVVSTDGNPVSPAYLKVFKDDTLVLASPELKGQAPSGVGKPVPLPAPGLRPGVRPLPANPGGIQILPVAPADPAPAKPVN
jgi:hypothetical protein